MPITTRWLDNEQDIIHIEFEGDWTWDELYPVRDQAREQIQSVSQTAHVLLDFTNSGRRLPANLISHFRRLGEQRLPNTGTFFVMSRKKSLARTIIQMIGRLSANFPVRFVESFEEVKAYARPQTD